MPNETPSHGNSDPRCALQSRETLDFDLPICSDQIRIGAQENQSVDVALYVLRASLNVSQFCHIEKDSISRSGYQSKIRRLKSQSGWVFSSRPEAALPARNL
jgi:hypothetical protein